MAAQQANATTWHLVARYDKSHLQDLPRVVFPGPIHVVISPAEAARAVECLMNQPILGFDTETRPSFQRGHRHQVALLQVATHDCCFLFRLCRTGLTDDIVRLLEDTQRTKVALSWHDDVLALSHTRPFKPGSFVELQDEVKLLGIEDMSLQKIYANLLGERICKSQQLSNWEADALSIAQQQYAAIDAWACIRIHERVQELLRIGNYTLAPTNDEADIPEAR